VFAYRTQEFLSRRNRPKISCCSCMAIAHYIA